MTQRYQIENEFPARPDNEDEAIQQDLERSTPLGDMYDVYGMASNVHSKITDMTRDYTLGKYNTEIINAKFPKFIREQRKVVRIMKSFMLPTMASLLKRFPNMTLDEVKSLVLAMKQNYMDVERLLLGELDEMVIISRAGKGEVLTAMLVGHKDKEERAEYEQQMADSLKDKLTQKV